MEKSKSADKDYFQECIEVTCGKRSLCLINTWLTYAYPFLNTSTNHVEQYHDCFPSLCIYSDSNTIAIISILYAFSIYIINVLTTAVNLNHSQPFQPYCLPPFPIEIKLIAPLIKKYYKLLQTDTKNFSRFLSWKLKSLPSMTLTPFPPWAQQLLPGGGGGSNIITVENDWVPTLSLFFSSVRSSSDSNDQWVST